MILLHCLSSGTQSSLRNYELKKQLYRGVSGRIDTVRQHDATAASA